MKLPRFQRRTPLAWRNLTTSWRKLLLAASGVGFAVLLMFSQLGFRNGLFDSTVQIIRILDGDLFIVSAARYTVSSEQRFDRNYLNRVKTIPGVDRVQPVYVSRVGTELRVIGHPSRSIRLIGVPLEGRVFANERMDAMRESIRGPGTGLLDSRTKKMYGLERNDVDKLRNQSIELLNKSINLVGYVEIGTDFVNDGTIVVSTENFESYVPFKYNGQSVLSGVDIGLVQLQPGANIQAIRDEIQSFAPQHWDVLTKQGIINRDVKFWGQSTPIGIIFTVGTIMGLVVGTIICYQILFTEISDHIGEFATLKAMGYSSMYFFQLIMMQSMYLTLFGFFPAASLTVLMFWTLTETTGLVMILTPVRVLTVFVLTLIMCLVGGILAVRKLLASDPATLFK
jgi:putative ABC transport system permease protein